MQIFPLTTETASETARLISRTLRACNLYDYGAERIAQIEHDHSAEALLELARNRDILLAIEASSVIGTAALQRNWIYAVFVDPERQREGIGRLLLDELARIAAERRIVRLGVYSSISAVGFYERIGFTIEATIDSAHHGHLTEMSRPIPCTA